MKIIYKDGHVDECPQDQELHVIRHTAAHIMAQAIKRLYPQADFAFGPATENGFYYDVDLGDQKLSDEDLANIEKEMRKIVKENLPIKPFIPHTSSRDEAPEKVRNVPRFHPNCTPMRATRCAVTGAPGRGSPLRSAVVELRHMAGCLQHPCGAALSGSWRNRNSVCPHHRFYRMKLR